MIDLEEDIRSLQLESAGTVLRLTTYVLSVIFFYQSFPWRITGWTSVLNVFWELGFNLAEDYNGAINPEDAKPEELEKMDETDEGWW